MIYFSELNGMNIFSEKNQDIIFACIKLPTNSALFIEHQDQVAIIIN